MFVGVSQVDKGSEIPADGFRQWGPWIRGQELRQPEYIVAMFPDVLLVYVATGLEWYEQGLVDDRDAVERLVTGIVQQDCRKAHYVLVYRYPCVNCVFGQVEVTGRREKSSIM